MKTKRPTTDEIYAEIRATMDEQRALLGRPESPGYWRAVADLAERQRDLWRQLGTACDSDTPEWARIAAFRTGDLYSDQASTYRRYALETTR